VVGLGLAVVTLVGRVGFSDNGFWVGLVGLFVVADGLFVVADDDGLVVGFRVGFLVVVFPLVGFLVTVEAAVVDVVVSFRE